MLLSPSDYSLETQPTKEVAARSKKGRCRTSLALNHVDMDGLHRATRHPRRIADCPFVRDISVESSA